MAQKNKPYAVFQTKEEFDRSLEQMYNSGRETGFKEGLTTALSYILEMMDDRFDNHDMYVNAEYQVGARRKAELRQRQKIIDYAKKTAIEEYIKSREES